MIFCMKFRRLMMGQPNSFLLEMSTKLSMTHFGGVAKDRIEIENKTGQDIIPLELTGNYRSSQRMIDYYRNFQVDELEIEATNKYVDEVGRIILNEVVSKDTLELHISKLISYYLENDISEKEICVLAPSWRLIAPIGRKLKQILPDVSF